MSKSKYRLFIKKIEIENCGRFYGKGHSILLSDSPEKNITIIIGESGRGKSTIHDLIYWCLYGEHKKHGEEDRDAYDYGLVNVDALENLVKGQSVTASVTLTLHDDKEEKYVLTRSLTATLNRESSSRKFDSLNNSRVPTGVDFEQSSKLVMKDDLGQKVIEKNQNIIKNEINKMFPQNLSDFFLFDGENLVKFRNQSTSSQLIKDGVEKISGLTILDSLRSHSVLCADSLTNHIGGKTANSAPFIANKQRIKAAISELETRIAKNESDLRKKRVLYDQVTKQIELDKEGHKLIQDQKIALNHKNDAANELRENNEAFKDFLFESIPRLLLKDTLAESEKIFSRLEDEDKIPPVITRAAIDKILNSNPLRCVCGREFEKNSDKNGPWIVLNQIKDAIIEDDISQGISLGRTLMGQVLDQTSKQSLTSKYNEFKQTRTAKTRQFQEFDAEYRSLDEKIKLLPTDPDEDLPSKKIQLWAEIEGLAGDIKIDNSELEDRLSDEAKNEKELNDALAKESKYDSEKNKIAFAKAVSKFSKELRLHIVELLRKQTEHATSKYFLESAPEKATFDHVEISENYDITVRDSSNLVATLSKGQAHVLGLSYVSGSRDITHTNTFLIIDSPLHNISGVARNEVSQVFSKYLPGVQLVFLVTDTEYLHGDPNGAEPVKNILRKNNRVWKEYEIQQYTTDNGIESRKIVEYKD